ncbi:MAG TPA: DUF2723 domain-containing protein [Thermoanaerobaculia bacterium]|nr:DUF2723 domain-containing protein [Thermoanaerobaculia bacterium]
MSEPIPSAPGVPRPSRYAWAAPVAAAGVCLGVYAARIDSWVGVADTAKFQLIGATLGTPHAPGYPAYVLLLHLMSRLLPFLSWAASADVFSALCIAANVALVALAAEEIRAGRLASLAAALAFGLLPAIRNVASEAEVYPFHLLLIAGALLALLRWRREGKLGQLVTAGALFSLGLSHHPTIVCSLPAALLLLASRRLPVRRLLVWLPLFALIALAPFAYVVWRSYSPVTSGVEMQAHSAAQLWDGLSGAQHRANLQILSLGTILRERLPWIARSLWHEEGWLLALALLGLWGPGDRRGRQVVALLVAGNLAFTLIYTVPDLDVFLLPVHLGLALAIARGAHRLFERLPGPRLLVPLAGAAVALSPIIFGPPSPISATEAAAQEMAAVVDAMPRNAILVSFDYPRSMALQYQAWRRRGGLPRLVAIPQAGLVVPLLTDRLRRHLSGGTPFRFGPRDELAAPGAPLVCYCPEESAREALARQGFATEPILRPGLYRLHASPAGPPTLPAALWVDRRITVSSLHEATAALFAPGFDPRKALVRIGPEKEVGEEGGPGGGTVVLREVSANALVADIANPGGGWLVLTDLYNSRWRVLVDGQPARSFRADVLFMALGVPAGDHRVELRRDRRPFSLRRFVRGPWGYLLP